MTVVVRISNTYSDGHSSTQDVALDDPPRGGDELADWWEATVFEHTGDGHGIGVDLGSYSLAMIVKADDDSLIGLYADWSD